MAAKNAAAAAVLQQPNVLSTKPGTSAAAAGVHIAAAQGGMQFPSNLLLSHLASGTYVLSPVSPNAPQNLLAAGSQLITPVSQQTIVTVQQNPITTGQQQRDGTQLVGFPGASHQVTQLPVQASTLNTLKLQQHHSATAAGSLVSPRDMAAASPKEQDPPSKAASSRSMFSFEQVAHEQQQRNIRKSSEHQQYRHRKNSRQQQAAQMSSSNEQPMNLEFKGGEAARSSQTLATQTSPVSYYPASQPTPPAAAGMDSNRSSIDDNSSQPSSSPLPAVKNLISGFMPIQSEAPYNSGRKQSSSGGKQHYRDNKKDTKTSESSASGIIEGAENSNSRSSVRVQSPEDPLIEGEIDDTAKRLSPSPHHAHEENYQVYRKAFHKIQDEQDFEAATTLATLSKRSKLHHLEPSSYSMDSVSSSLQAAGAGDERPDDERKHRLPHKLRFKLHTEGPQEGEQPSKHSE